MQSVPFSGINDTSSSSLHQDTHEEELRRKAEDGFVEDQFRLGQYLLENAKPAELTERTRAGVTWLTRAASGGHQDATSLLSSCLEQKTGIDEGNEENVQRVLSMDENEREIRKAAAQLYSTLKPPHSGIFEKQEYYEAVKSVSKTPHEKKFLRGTGRKLKEESCVKESDFINTLSRRMCSGQIDPLQDVDEMEAYNKSSFVRKLAKYPGATLTMTFDAAVEFATGDGVQLALSCIPVDQINVLIAFFLLSIISLSWLFTVICGVVFYVTFVILLVCSLQMFKNKRKQQEVAAMASMLKKYNDKIDPKAIESDFVVNSMRPYWTFFCALFLFVPCFYMMNMAWVPCSELALLSWVLGLAYIYQQSDFSDPVVISSLLLNFISTLPHFVTVNPQRSGLAKLVSYLINPVLSIKLMKHFYLNISVPALCNVLLAFLFVGMVISRSWRGICQSFVPHMVGFFWWQISVIFYDFSSWFGLARASFGWLSFALLMPFITIAGFFYGIYSFLFSVKLATLLKICMTSLIILAPVGLSIWQSYNFSLGGYYIKGKSVRKRSAVLIVFLLIGGAVSSLFFLSDDGDGETEVTHLPWQLYASYCGPESARASNLAQRQVDCYVFKDMQVNWTGTVEQVNITHIENSAMDFLNSLPTEVGEWLKCLYGTPFESCDQDGLGETEVAVCKMRQAYGKLCHMRHANSYTFMITVSIDSDEHPGSFYVKAGHDFHKVIMRLREGHVVNIQGYLTNRLGTASPEISMADIVCLNCMADIMDPMEAHVKSTTMVSKLISTALQTVSFFSSPLLEYDDHSAMPNVTTTSI